MSGKRAGKFHFFGGVIMADVKKRLIYVRHSLKDGANNAIGPKGIALTQEKAVSASYTDIFYGIYRTVQTALAYICHIGCAPGTRVHTPIAEIGTDELFAVMVNDAFKAAVKSGKTNIQALYLAGHSEEQLAAWANNALNGVKKMFDAMPEDGLGLAFGHDPIIPLATIALGYGGVPSLKEMEYLHFELRDNDTITIYDPREIYAP
jgi:hypothetical protein